MTTKIVEWVAWPHDCWQPVFSDGGNVWRGKVRSRSELESTGVVFGIFGPQL